jgi:hypothetical protein
MPPLLSDVFLRQKWVFFSQSNDGNDIRENRMRANVEMVIHRKHPRSDGSSESQRVFGCWNVRMMILEMTEEVLSSKRMNG